MRRSASDTSGRVTLGIALVILAVLLMFMDHLEVLRPAEQVTSALLSPLQRGMYQLGANLSRFSDFFSDNEKLRAENEALRKDLQTALDSQGKVADLANQVDLLEKQLAFRKNPSNRKFNIINADVLNRDAAGVNVGIIINKGSNDNLKRGMPVVDSSGYLVGRLAKVETKQSYVILINDSNVGVNVYTQRYGSDNRRVPIQPVDGTAYGQYQLGTDDKVKISRILPEGDIQPLDWVFTSGIGNTYPPNLLLGKIERIISQDGQPEKEATVKPIADLEHLQQVLVVTSWGEE